MPVLETKNLKKYFPVSSGIFQKKTRKIRAVDGVSFSLKKGQTLGIVGESGCGKTTLGRCLMGLYSPDEGQVLIKGQSIAHVPPSRKKQLSRTIQMIFQDPFESLDPRQTIGQILEEKYRIHGVSPSSIQLQAMELLEQVGLPSNVWNKFPHEFSGGQRQRIGIARAVSMHPEIIICDEPVSALDLSVQSRIINLLLSLQKTLHLTYVFISHDLSVVRHVSDTIAVMYLGKIVEMGKASNICDSGGQHPYTRALFSAIPILDPDIRQQRILLSGEVPSNIHLPKGCRFHPRCPFAMNICLEQEPVLISRGLGPDHLTACHLALPDDKGNQM